MLKVSLFNCDESVLLNPILGRPFSNNIDRINLIKNHEDCDFIFGYLDYLNCNEDFLEISKTEIYQKYKHKFVFYSMHDNPKFAYIDKEPIKIICQPITEDIENNNIIVCPLQMRHFEWEIIQDLNFIDKCRKQNKDVDLTFIGQPRYWGRELIFKSDFSPLTTNFKATGSIYSIQNTQQRISIMKDFYVETARSKFTISPRGMGSSSFRFYQSLMVGSVPILSGHVRLPFEDKIDYDKLCIRLNLEEKDYVNKLHKIIRNTNYEEMREYGMKTWDDYFRIDRTDKHIFDILKNEKIGI